MVCFPFLCSANKSDVAEIPLEVVQPGPSDNIAVEEKSIVIEEPVETNEPVTEEEISIWYGTISALYNEGKEYYTLPSDKDGIIYFGSFPIEWATNHEYSTGPSQCEMCYINGMHSEVFLGYCVGCAVEVYGGKRGRGFFAPGQESKCDQLKENNEIVIISSAFETYLKDVDLDLVGKEYIWYGINVEKEYMYNYDDSELLVD
jgi:hypothetical protein